ncbi:MAG: alpha/beta fold hydrolase [Microvirga sp.]|jgi:pimeloyl-ACP methyl ester carboxylesterase
MRGSGKPDRRTVHRRGFLGGATALVAAAELSAVEPANAQARTPARQLPAIKPGTNTSFGALKQIDAGVLNVGYAEAGPADGPVVVLLHGWPYDIHSFVDVAPSLAAAGYRVIVPYLRGYGTTRFLSSATVRNGQPSALAVDLKELLDALKLEKPILAGFDWGARTANIFAALWPERTKAMVSVSGYLIGNQEAGRMPLPPRAELEWWYQFYFATDRGRAGYEKYRHEFSKLIWQLASPKWQFDDATFDRSAAAFDNPDHVDIVIHNPLAARLGRGRTEIRRSGKPACAEPGHHRPDHHTRKRCQRCASPRSGCVRKEIFRAHRHITGGIGHNLPQEAPRDFAQAVIDVAGV